MNLGLTQEQEEIIKISKAMKNREVLKINACAGSGKTTTLREIALANPDKKFLYLAFNKAIVEESKNKFPENVTLQTVHSLAYQAIIAPKKAKVIKSYTIFDYMEHLGLGEYQEAQTFKLFLDSFLNSDDILESADFRIQKWFNMAKEGQIPYTHNLYLKEYELNREKRALKKYDFILLDEAQDTNKVTLSIFLRNDCKKILVGDTFQNIYGFRETINALEIIEADYKCDLSHSFRCKQQILNKAFYFLEKYAINGENPIWMKSSYRKQDKKPTKALITRLNASIVNLIDKSLREGDSNRFCLLKEPNVLLESSIAIFWFLRQNENKIPSSYSWIKKFNDEDDLCKYIEESGDQEIKIAFDNVIGYGEYIFTILNEAKRIYNRKDDFDSYLLNAHLSKGLEFNEITLYDDFFCLSSNMEAFKETLSQNQKEELKETIIQERNLYYVALTRAKEKIIDRSENHIEYIKFIQNLQKYKENRFEIGGFKYN